MSRAWRVRPETAGDVDAVRAVHVAAFPRGAVGLVSYQPEFALVT